MNRYPVWKYAIIVIALLVGVIYTLPNFFGEAPAVQVSAGKATVKVDSTTQARVEQALAAAGIKPEAITLDATSVKVRLDDTDDLQLKAKDAIQKALVPDPDRPLLCGRAEPAVGLARSGCRRCAPRPCTWAWTCAAACTSCCRSTCRRRSTKKAESLRGRPAHPAAREERPRMRGINRNGQAIEVRFRDTAGAGGGQGRAGGPVPRPPVGRGAGRHRLQARRPPSSPKRRGGCRSRRSSRTW